MQEWSEEFESALNVHSLPTPDLDCSLEEYITIICGENNWNKNFFKINIRTPVALLDIPVHSSKIASLHLLFNLYNEFRNSQVIRRN